MTLAQSTRYKLYQPTVLTSQFVIPFPIFATEDITVYLAGIAVTGYTINATFLNGRATNAVVVLNFPVTDVDVEIYGTRSPRRENQYLGNSPDLSNNLQNDADALTAVQQEQARDYATSLRTSVGSPPVSPLNGDAASRAGRSVAFSGDGLSLIAGPSSDEISQAQGHANTALAQAGVATAAAATVASLQAPQVIAVTTNRTIVTSDGNGILRTDARRILTLPVPTLFGNGFGFSVDGAGAGANITPAIGTTLTVIGFGAYNGFEILPGQFVEVFTDGTNWFAYLTSRELFHRVYVDRNLASPPHVDVDVPTGARGFRYRYDCFVPVSDNSYLVMQVGNSISLITDNSSYYTMDYGFSYAGAGAALLGGGFVLSVPTKANTTYELSAWGKGEFIGFHEPFKAPRFFGRRAGVTTSGTVNDATSLAGRMPGTPLPLTVANRIRFLTNSGNIRELDLRIDWEF